MAKSFSRLEELNLSRDEVNRIGEALKKEEFRKLLADYVQEIEDPKNRQIYEEEVKQIERERGEEVTFLHPIAGYVIKTSVNGSQKGFVNICSNENIGKPSSTPSSKNGAKGLQWSLPHSLSPPHEDIDNKGVRCQVYDIVFHPDSLHLASKNRDFRSMVNNIALDAVEKNFNVSLDRKNLKFPKMSYKGMKRASIMRKKCLKEQVDRTPEEEKIFEKIYSEIDSQRSSNSVKNSPRKSRTRRNSSEDVSSYTTPKYIIKHRSHVDIQDFTEHRNAKLNVTVPNELIVEINLPLLKSSGDINLDVTEKTLHLVSEEPAKYKLTLTLPYKVYEANGSAKFEKDLKRLVVTLPVKQKNIYDVLRDDSGVESCVDSDINSPTNHESEDESENENKLFSVTEYCKKLECENKQSVEERTESDKFLDAGEHYNFPEFGCNVFDNIVAFTLNVKNVDEHSVFKRYSPKDSLIKVKFTSVSSTFCSSCYSFFVQFPNHKFIEDEVTIETWDNNVILQIPLMASENQFVSYFVGANMTDLTEKFVEEPALINRTLEKTRDAFLMQEHTEVSKDGDKKFRYTEGNLKDKDIIILKTEIQKQNEDIKPPKYVSKAIDIFSKSIPTSYESSGDELSASSFSPRKSKGILKRISNNRSMIGRSVSESSLDDFVYSSFENYPGSIECVPENERGEEEAMSSSMKKTVRFNEHVTRQLFRSNSSILGQKKKNQRKARNKKRACERRYSESEASDSDNKKETDYPTSSDIEKGDKDRDGTHLGKKYDVDIFHLEINS